VGLFNSLLLPVFMLFIEEYIRNIRNVIATG
jgi:hypothetical protein